MKTYAAQTKQPASAATRRRTVPSATSMAPHAAAHRAQIREILHAPRVQAKLTIGAPDDKYEQEADRVADQVMRMPEPNLQRQPENEEEEEEEEEPVQAKSMPGQMPEVVPSLESKINRLKGGGHPLDPSSRSFFEPRFGCDFSNVLVHADSNASDAAKSINARAFTRGNHIVMGSGEYQPTSPTGQRLLGHELTHVIQQSEGRKSSKAKKQESIESNSISAINGRQIQRSLVSRPRLGVQPPLLSDASKGLLGFVGEFFEEGMSSTAVLGSMAKAAMREGFENVQSFVLDSELPIPKRELLVALDGLNFVFDTVVDVYVFELSFAMGVTEGLLEMLGGLLHLAAMIADLLISALQDLLSLEGTQDEVIQRWREFIDGLLGLPAAIETWHEQWQRDFRAASPSEKNAMAGRLFGQVLAVIAAVLVTSGSGVAGTGAAGAGRPGSASRLARMVTPEGVEVTVVVEETAAAASGVGTKAGAAAGANMGPPTVYAVAQTPKATSAKGARVPSDAAGTWTGKRGEGVFTPKGTKWKIPFRKGRPDFSAFVEPKHLFARIKGLTGQADRGIMFDAVIKRFGRANGFSTRQGAESWLRTYRTKYGTGLHMHHSGVQRFQLVPEEVHNAAQHGGFPGSASHYRGP